VIEDVVIVRLDLESIMALLRVSIIVEISFPEHILLTISTHRHNLISTGQDIPSAHVLISRRISVDLVACGFVVEVVVISNRLLDC